MNEIYNLVMDDLNILSELSEKLVNKMPHPGLVEDGLYLQHVAIQIFIISQLEYFLKKKGVIQSQREIKDVIKNSSLEQIEKDHLLFLFNVRHTLVHNGGYADSTFLYGVSELKELKLKGFKEGSLTTIDSTLSTMYIELVKKLINELQTKKSN